jgi:hypothetical protein
MKAEYSSKSLGRIDQMVRLDTSEQEPENSNLNIYEHTTLRFSINRKYINK